MQADGFKRVALQGWRQFEDVDIELHDRLTIITGANGAGKSSLLRIFSRHFGFDRPYLATPVLKEGKYVFSAGVFVSLFRRISKIVFDAPPTSHVVGELHYSNGQKTNLNIPEASSVAMHLKLQQAQTVKGVHIDSHQPVSTYQLLSNIPAHVLTAEQMYDSYFSEVTQKYNGGHTGSSPLFRMKESIVAMAVFGEGNSRSAGNPALLEALNSFIGVLKKILPPSLGFLDLVVRGPEIVVKTKTGEFLLDAASGGVATLFDVAFRLHMFSLGNEFFVVTMDEPENHLHPSMQRSLMPRLLDAFPKAQFIVATHSPFIVSSVRESAVYVLRYNHSEKREIDGFVPETTSSRVISELLDTVNKSSTANEILREVLGVEATVPEWVSEAVRSIVNRYSAKTLSTQVFAELRSELKALGYESQYPSAMADLVRFHDQAN
jgi:predicted ATPase